ncbi:hypothetical protein CICLE_v10002858mg [Citrus x clementina]|uniref:Uncharacterized protein n=1 Tax=Citrus clementina TaxID=85681 RepID=V4T664_CITCL|nr:hypothetical protein CICLE_v10002858mg [Citrus x clementina]
MLAQNIRRPMIFASPILYQTVLISLISLLMSSVGRSLLPKIPLIYLLVWFGMLLGMWLELECYWKMVGCWVWVGLLLGVCIGVLECGCWSIPTRRGHYCWKSILKSYCWNISINLWKFCWVT